MDARSSSATKEAPLVVERTFDAPVALVWEALTDPDQIRRWSFDMKGFTPRVGAEFEFTGGDPDGVQYLHRCKVVELQPGKKLAYTWCYEGYAGDSLVVFELFPEGGKTRLRLTHEGLETFPALAAFDRKNFKAGWTEIVGTSLKNFVEGRHAGEMILTRVFDAPRALVWKAWTDPEQIVQWWGPKGFTLPGCDLDFRAGGKYRFVMRAPDGSDFPFRGVYREIVANQRIVFTCVIEREAIPELLVTVVFEDQDGKTRLTVRQTAAPGEAGRGQHQGWSESLERLAEHLRNRGRHG